MRLLLAAITCEKGDLAGNLARHLDLLADAHAGGCDLVVFPEMSLTGSVDPEQHPERAVALDHEAVDRLARATQRYHVGALFGIGERRLDGAWITQVYAQGGAVRGVQRKPHLGEDEGGFRVATETEVFDLGAARFGSIICAESHMDAPWDANAAAGAALHLLSAAPGLSGRRLDDAGWQAGLSWWESAGLHDARHQAQRLEAWVAIATQAGATVDEDFPGLAALVSPSGEVVARTPDERPATLVVDVPLHVEVDPIRRSIRVLVVDDRGRTLLAQFGDDHPAQSWWVPPAGGMEPGEDDLATARRELQEELGRDDLEIGPLLGSRAGTFRVGRGWLTQHERWYLCRAAAFEVDPAVVAALRAEGIRQVRWWSVEELRASDVLTGPRDLADLLEGIVAGRLPDPGGALAR